MQARSFRELKTTPYRLDYTSGFCHGKNEETGKEFLVRVHRNKPFYRKHGFSTPAANVEKEYNNQMALYIANISVPRPLDIITTKVTFPFMETIRMTPTPEYSRQDIWRSAWQERGLPIKLGVEMEFVPGRTVAELYTKGSNYDLARHAEKLVASEIKKAADVLRQKPQSLERTTNALNYAIYTVETDKVTLVGHVLF